MLRAAMGGVLGDEKALSELFGSKGASGTKPCWMCANCVAVLSERASQEHGATRLVDSDCRDLDAFVQHTSATIYAAVDRLDAFVGTKAAKGELEKALGLKHEPHGLLLARELRTFCPVRSVILWDPMHIILSMFAWEVHLFFELLGSRSQLRWASFATYLTTLDWRVPRPGVRGVATEAGHSHTQQTQQPHRHKHTHTRTHNCLQAHRTRFHLQAQRAQWFNEHRVNASRTAGEYKGLDQDGCFDDPCAVLGARLVCV